MAELEEFLSEDYMSFLQKINPGIIDQYKDQLATCTPPPLTFERRRLVQ